MLVLLRCFVNLLRTLLLVKKNFEYYLFFVINTFHNGIGFQILSENKKIRNFFDPKNYSVTISYRVIFCRKFLNGMVVYFADWYVL